MRSLSLSLRPRLDQHPDGTSSPRVSHSPFTPRKGVRCDLRLGAARGLRGGVGWPLLCSPLLLTVLPWRREVERTSVAAHPIRAVRSLPGDDSGVSHEAGGDRRVMTAMFPQTTAWDGFSSTGIL